MASEKNLRASEKNPGVGPRMASHRPTWDPATCARQVANGTFSHGVWKWRHARTCGFHTIETEEVHSLLSGRQFLYIGNSILRQDTYTTLHLALGKGPETPIAAGDDRRWHSAHTVVVDLTARTFRTFHPGELPLCRNCGPSTYFTGSIDKAADVGPVTISASWHVAWSAGVSAGDRHGELDSQLSSSFPWRPQWASLLRGPPVLRMRVALGGRTFVQAFLLARRPVEAKVFAADLAAWARGGCTAAVGCLEPHARDVRVASVQGNTGFRENTLQCPGSFQQSVRRALADGVPVGHRWTVLSYIFAFMGAEGAVAMHRCEHYSERSWGYGADLVVVSSHLVDEFMVPLQQRRRLEQSCFRDNSSTSAVLVRPALWSVKNRGGMEAQTARQAATEAADRDFGTLASGTYFLDDAAAAAAAVRDSATGIGRYDGLHFNDTGRLFLVQLSLNWMRQWQRGAGVLAS